jgi:NAD(P)H-quinone oxidoreductase subunit 5
LDLSPTLCAIVVVWGLITAVFGALASRVQADVKTALAFASLTQVGIIVAEIGFGLRYLALIHIIGHACLRTLQLVRAPTLLHDYHQLENALGTHLPRRPNIWQRLLPDRIRRRVYRLALERGFLDTALNDFVVRPFVHFFRKCDALERRWTDWLAGAQSRESDRLEVVGAVADEP